MKQSIGALIYRLRSNIRTKQIQDKFNKSIASHIPIIVYQMGKVASMSVYTSLKEQYPGTTLHRHELIPTEWQDATLLNHTNNLHKPLLIISMMRDPIARNISAFFQNFEVITGVKPADSKFSMKELETIYFTNPKMDHDPPYTWFDKNIKRHLGIDIFAQPFPKEEGSARFKNGSIEVLLMKAEIDNTKKEKLIKELTRLNSFELKSSNVGEDKEYAGMYSEFKKSVTIPKEYLDTFYNSPAIKYFYTDAEIESMRKKWKTI